MGRLRDAFGGLLSALLLVTSLMACGTSERDRIDEFVRAMSGELNRQRVEHVIDSYVDLTRQPLTVSVFGEPRGYDSNDAETLKAQADRRLSFLYGRTLSILRQKIEIASGQATVDLQLFSRGGGGSVRYVLTKRRGESWLLAELHVSN